MIVPASNLLESVFYVQTALALPAAVLIFALAPQEDVNKPLSDNEKSHYKKTARVVLAVEILAVIALYAFGNDILLTYFALSAINLTGVNVTLKAIQNKINQKRPI